MIKLGFEPKCFFMKKSKFFELSIKNFWVVTKNDERVHSLCLIHHAQVLNKISVSNCFLKCEKQSNRREITENQKKTPENHPRQERVKRMWERTPEPDWNRRPFFKILLPQRQRARDQDSSRLHKVMFHHFSPNNDT